ncbi:MAG: hypothetical protein QOD74_581 [Variibacter sp.]|jgi:hypothetical protein|nr:hypothetical protein [Variibacter sp.]
MTISQNRSLRGVRFALIAAGALSVWFGVIVGVTAFAEPTRSVLVIGGSPAHAMSAALNAEVQLLSGSGRALAVIGTERGFVRHLYAGGAWLVLPAILGCRRAAAAS